jgi:hypothetical protein
MSHQKKFTQRIAAAAGTMAGVAAMPATTEAAVVSVTGAPVSLSLSAANGTSVTWDIDGDSVSEFRLHKVGGTFGGFFSYNEVRLASNTSASGIGNGRGLLGLFSDKVQALSASFVVGPSGLSTSWGFSFNNGSHSQRRAMSSGTFLGNQYGPFIGSDFASYGFGPGSNFFGFRFNDGIGTGLNYGWGVIDFDLTSGTVTISEWHYETDDNVGVHIDAVPEPNSLVLLAAGAAGVAAYRRRRTTKAATESTDSDAAS